MTTRNRASALLMTRSARIVLNIFNILLQWRNELHLGRPAIDS